jgi:hypothetical protein
MKKIILSILFINTISITVFGQTKKEKIEVLTFKLDSLNLVIKSKMIDINIKDTLILDLKNQIKILNTTLDKSKLEKEILKESNFEKDQEIKKKMIDIHIKDTMIWDLENQIKILNTTLEKRKLEEKILKESNFKKDQEIQKKNDSIIDFHQEIRSLRDSIQNSIQKIDTLLWEIPDLYWEQIESNLKLILPASNFTNPKGNILISNDKKIKISYDYNNTNWSDQEDVNPLFYNEKDAINYYSKDLHDIELSYNEGFIIIGKNTTNQLLIIKGLYTEFVSMQGRVEGDPMWLWSNTLAIKATVNQKDKEEFNYISNLLINNFSTKSIISK